MVQRLTQIIAELIFAAGIAACGQTTIPDPVRNDAGHDVGPMPEMYRETSLLRRPDKVLRNGYGETIILTDFDNDGNFDVEEWLGSTPGAYRVRISKQCSGFNIELVDQQYFDQYRED